MSSHDVEATIIALERAALDQVVQAEILMGLSTTPFRT